MRSIPSAVAAGNRRIRTAAGTVALIGATALVLTACNDKAGTATPTSAVASSAAATSVVTNGQPGGKSGQSTVRAVGKTGWFDGFAITVDTATLVPDEYGGAKVLIDITYKNTTLDNKTMGNNTSLLVDDEVDGGASWDNPTVPGGGSATGKVTTPVESAKDAEHLLDTMTVVYGQASDNQTKIPLSAAGKVESVQPKTLPITGTLVQGHTTIEVTAGKLDPSYAKNERGKNELALHIKITGGQGVPAGGANIFTEYFSLKTPDGKTVVADDRSPINELLDAGKTIDNPKNYVVFVLPTPTTGDYVLSYNSQKEEGAATAPTFAFTVS
ncbi:hypothetical protein NONI108955_38795 [Nocardia ninae]|uniref:Uncharacterized protein n=1 Tax=Nocardia ninae NBRC 108245 TaxID=1210091 RepID=A0A511MKU0_9NOCA|nr:hypothetical protein [Nocardia ninae]GEM40757.1 hypothetical protein NN4_52760 [Nocardia ninae NBRC 108245]